MKRLLDEMERDEGSLILAILLMVILAGLGGLLLVSTVMQSKNTQHDQKFTTALPAADAGISRGLFMLNNGIKPSCNGNLANPMPLSSCPSTITVGNQPGNWYANVVSPSNAPTYYELHATSTEGGVTRTLQATAYQSARFPVAAFADTSVVFRGGNVASSYNSKNNNTTSTGNGRIGSNGSVTVEGNAAADGVDLYNWTSDPNTARCSGTVCSTGQTTYPNKFDITSANATNFISSALSSCGPNLSSWTTSTSSPTAHTLPSGTWCASSLNLDVDTTVTQPTTIYVSGNVTTGTHLNINYSSTSVPKPANLQIYMLGSKYDMSNHTTIAAAIYAPLATCYGGAQSVVYGSLICGSISNVGGWMFHYDDALATIGGGDFRIKNYREGS